MKPTFFQASRAFRTWLERNHSSTTELLVGFYKVGSGRPSMTWPESVDEALCFGWIDGLRKGLDEESYTVRFTPRKLKSTWSSVNIKRVEVLAQEGRMHPAGLAAQERRIENRSSIYSYEQCEVNLPEPFAGLLQKNKLACKFFEHQIASYRKAACWWVVSAKKEETRWKRFHTLVELSEQGQWVP